MTIRRTIKPLGGNTGTIYKKYLRLTPDGASKATGVATNAYCTCQTGVIKSRNDRTITEIKGPLFGSYPLIALYPNMSSGAPSSGYCFTIDGLWGFLTTFTTPISARQWVLTIAAPIALIIVYKNFDVVFYNEKDEIVSTMKAHTFTGEEKGSKTSIDLGKAYKISKILIILDQEAPDRAALCATWIGLWAAIKDGDVTIDEIPGNIFGD